MNRETSKMEADLDAALANEAAFRRRPLMKATFFKAEAGKTWVRFEWLDGKTVIQREATPADLEAWPLEAAALGPTRKP